MRAAQMIRLAACLITLAYGKVLAQADPVDRSVALVARARTHDQERQKIEWRRAMLVPTPSDSLVLLFAQGQRVATMRDGDWIVEVNPSRRRSRRSHVAIGVVGGMIVGTAALFFDMSHCVEHGDGPPCAIEVVFLPTVLLAGGVIGAITGALLPAAHWSRITR
ncbi:MAG: hypothetical protein ABJA80_05905 [bacterium]